MTPPEPSYERDTSHWLYRHSPEEWIRAAMLELQHARAALDERNVAGAAAGLKRAAGMSLNGALIVHPNEAWGRTYVEHLRALSCEPSAPDAVQAAARTVCEIGDPARGLVALLTPSLAQSWVEAARTVMAHAYALVYGSAGRWREA